MTTSDSSDSSEFHKYKCDIFYVIKGNILSLKNVIISRPRESFFSEISTQFQNRESFCREIIETF